MKPRIFLLEDYPGQRISRADALELRGFDCHSPASIEEARVLAERLAGQFDVAVLDMRLEKFADNSKGWHGGDVGQWLLGAAPHAPPEFLVVSGYSEKNYYDAAIGLRVHAYLSKHDSVDDMEVVRHVRALAACALLRSPRHDADARDRRLARSVRSFDVLLKEWVRSVLVPVLSETLGWTFAVLLDEEGRDPETVEVLHEGFPIKVDDVASWRRVAATTAPEVPEADSWVLTDERRHRSRVDANFPVRGDLSIACIAALAGDRRVFLLHAAESGKEAVVRENWRAVTPIFLRFVKPVIEQRIAAIQRWHAEAAAERAHEAARTSALTTLLKVQSTRLRDLYTHLAAARTTEAIAEVQSRFMEFAEDQERSAELLEGAADGLAGLAYGLAGTLRAAWAEVLGTTGPPPTVSDVVVAMAEPKLRLSLRVLLQLAVDQAAGLPVSVGLSVEDRATVWIEEPSRSRGEDWYARVFDVATQSVRLMWGSRIVRSDLAIYTARALIEAAEGTVRMVAGPHGGNRIEIELPLAPGRG